MTIFAINRECKFRKCNGPIYRQTLTYTLIPSDENVTVKYFTDNSEGIYSAYLKVTKTNVVLSEMSSIVRGKMCRGNWKGGLSYISAN